MTDHQPPRPYGTEDLVRVLESGSTPERWVRCYVRDCEHRLQPPAKGRIGEVCPDHGIRCHLSSAGPTYSYDDPSRNIVVSPRTFSRDVLGNPRKFESHRFGLERSEDALTWNVFRSIQEAGLLTELGELFTGIRSNLEPHLFLWGLSLDRDDFRPWHFLEAARERFEQDLPVARPLTEPDAALHLPGKYLVLIEAKFTSPNTFYRQGPRRDTASLTLDELVEIYRDDRSEALDFDRARRAVRLPHQLWRNLIFSEWMARRDHRDTRFFLVNLVCEGREGFVEEEFRELIRPAHQSSFRRTSWEDIYRLIDRQPRTTQLRHYLETKTSRLLPAFCLRRRPGSMNRCRSPRCKERR